MCSSEGMRSTLVIVLFAFVVGCAPDGSGGDGGGGPEGQHCGGNTENPPKCPSGYTCKPDPSSTLPFGDVGGLCVKN